MKIISNCPLCENQSLHVIEKDDVGTQQCINCGYATTDKFVGTKNDNELYKKTKIKRSINRGIYKYETLTEQLDNKESGFNFIFLKLIEIINIRKKQKAFHPNSTQYTLDLGNNFFGLWRQSNDKQQSIFAISNITNKTLFLDISILNIINTEQWFDIFDKNTIKNELKTKKLKFLPYQSRWITNII